MTGSMIALVGLTSDSLLRGHRARIIFVDEVDSYPDPSVTKMFTQAYAPSWTSRLVDRSTGLFEMRRLSRRATRRQRGRDRAAARAARRSLDLGRRIEVALADV